MHLSNRKQLTENEFKTESRKKKREIFLSREMFFIDITPQNYEQIFTQRLHTIYIHLHEMYV